MSIDVVEMYISDLEDVRLVLNACYNYFLAYDLQQAQAEFRAQRPSPLTSEIERVKARQDGYFTDFLLAEHEAKLAEEDAQDGETVSEAEDGSEGPSEALSGAPLGEFTPPRQAGRRLTSEEL